MVDELYLILDTEREQIYAKMQALADGFNKFGSMEIDKEFFIKSKSSLLNKINRELTDDKEGTLRSFIAKDFIRCRGIVKEDNYKEAVKYLKKNYRIIRIKDTFKNRPKAPMVFVNAQIDPRWPAVEIQVFHYELSHASHFMYDLSRAEVTKDLEKFIDINIKAIAPTYKLESLDIDWDAKPKSINPSDSSQQKSSEQQSKDIEKALLKQSEAMKESQLKQSEAYNKSQLQQSEANKKEQLIQLKLHEAQVQKIALLEQSQLKLSQANQKAQLDQTEANKKAQLEQIKLQNDQAKKLEQL